MDAIYNRRSYHSGFDDTRTISDGDINEILRAGMNAPSAMNKQPWEFVVVNDRDKLKVLSKATLGTRATATASHAVVICAKPSSYAEIDTGIAVQNMALMATHLGVGSLIMGIHDNAGAQRKIKEALQIPDKYTAVLMVAFGHPHKQLPPNDKWSPKKIHLNKF